MTVSIVYHVSVDIPEDVWREFGHTKDYERRSIEAAKGNLAAGSNAYAEVEEWADFDSMPAARCCERNLQRMIEHFKGKLP